jgi:hypothetical protein
MSLQPEIRGTGTDAPVQGSRAIGPCPGDCTATPAGERTGDTEWVRAARYARWLAWASLAWMTAEGVVGLIAGLDAGSIALAGWALGSAIEALASVIVVWRFTGSRTLSETAERHAQKAVASSFWLLAPYIVIDAVRDLAGQHPARATALGIVLTASSVIIMPALGMAKRRLGARLHSGATASEGTQNLMFVAQAAAVLAGLAVIAVWPGGWPMDPIIASASPDGQSGKGPNPGVARAAASASRGRPGPKPLARSALPSADPPGEAGQRAPGGAPDAREARASGCRIARSSVC